MVRSPDLNPPAPQEKPTTSGGGTEALAEDGSPAMFLPRLNPKDVYFLYNPDQYYRVR